MDSVEVIGWVATLILSSSCHGATLRESTVKIASAFDDQSIVLRGSGLAFAKDGQAFVVTSDHVVLHDNDAKKHVITFSDGAKTEGEVLVSDFGRGLALLKLKAAAAVVDFNSLSQGQPLKEASVAMMGYPAMSEGLVRDTLGKLKDPALASDVFIQLPTLLEVTGGHAEFGMSGGVLADANGGFLGLLSQQIYSGGSNTILVLPASDIVSWLKAYFAKPDASTINFVQESDQATYHEDLCFSSGSLTFENVDAFGTGQKVLDLLLLSNPSRSALFPSGDLKKYESFLKINDCQIYLVGFRPRGSFSGGTIGLPSATVQIRWLSRSDIEPLTQIFCNDTEVVQQKISVLSERIRATLSQAGQDLELLRQIGFAAQSLEDLSEGGLQAYVMLKPSDIDTLLAGYADDWTSLERRGHALQIKQLLQDWKLIQQRLTI